MRFVGQSDPCNQQAPGLSEGTSKTRGQLLRNNTEVTLWPLQKACIHVYPHTIMHAHTHTCIKIEPKMVADTQAEWARVSRE